MKKDVTILLPCLNEEKTLEICIKNIKEVMDKLKYNYEILVSDNNSSDSSVKIAKKNKARVCVEEKRGYGNALINGIKNAYGKYIVMLDCDGSYNHKDIPKFLKELDNGYDLVMGNRFNKKTKKEASPFSHRIGARILSVYSNILYGTKLKDYHCGLRAFRKDKIDKIKLECDGMEFASEIIIKAKLNNFRIKEIDTEYFKDLREKKSHLVPIRDGYRHLKLITILKFKR
ncbi:MAG: glycosyltransferase family 2 protein [Firmicutes bacterium]|nr:glycosyltransferase family 2 protein [Bacillota bacterium]